MPNLRVLRAYHLYDHATGTLAANRSLKGLTHLLFHSHAGVRHLVACPDLPRLAHLELSRCCKGAASRSLPTVRTRPATTTGSSRATGSDVARSP
jgi:hypothetical protein